MAFVPKPGARLLCGHAAGRKVRLRREPTPEAGANFTGDELDNGEAVAVIKPGFEFLLVERQDGVQGFARARDLHVQAWTSERHPVLDDALTSNTFTWYSGDFSGRSFRVSSACLVYEDSHKKHRVHALASHAFTLDDGKSLFLLHQPPGGAGGPSVLVWDGTSIRQAAAVVGAAPPSGGTAIALAAGWEGVYTWATHEQSDRVGLQWVVREAGRTYRRAPAGAAPTPISMLSPHAWYHPDAGGGGRVYVLDEGGEPGQRSVVVWDARTAPQLACIAFCTTSAGLYGAADDAYRLAKGGVVVIGNTAHNGGGVLLRRRPDVAADDANLSGQQAFDGDWVEVLGVEGDGEWCHVAKAGVGDGWVRGRNVHVQGHGHGARPGAYHMPHVPGVNELGLPLPPEWLKPQPQNLMLVHIEPKSVSDAALEPRHPAWPDPQLTPPRPTSGALDAARGAAAGERAVGGAAAARADPERAAVAALLHRARADDRGARAAAARGEPLPQQSQRYHSHHAAFTRPSYRDHTAAARRSHAHRRVPACRRASSTAPAARRPT